MKKHPQIVLARRAFKELSHVFYSENTNHAEKLLEMCRNEERGHRGFIGEFNRCHTDDTASVSDCAYLFAVRRVAEYLSGEKMPIGQDYLHTQTSCFLAAAIADEYCDRILKAWKEFDWHELAKLNYTDVVKVRREEVAA